MREWKLISGDSHVNEPPDLWQKRVPAKFKDRAPRMQSFEQGDAWVMEGVKDPINFGMNFTAGFPHDQVNPWKRWDDVVNLRPGGYNPAARLKEQDQDGTDAEVMYPTPRPSIAVWTNNADREFHLACIRAYNDWLSEYCSHAPDRLIGMAMMPTTGVEASVAEARRTMKLPGMRGVLLGTYPSGEIAIGKEDDPFFAAVQEMGVPLSIHVGLATQSKAGDSDPNRKRPGAMGELRHLDAAVRTLEFIMTGVFDRFPKLNLVFAETGSSWVPYVKEQFDERFKTLNPATRPQLKGLPSEYFDQNIFTTYIHDRFGVINRAYVGVTQMLWSSDYPHAGGFWPNSWKVIESDYVGVPKQERHAILAGNAARLYGLS